MNHRVSWQHLGQKGSLEISLNGSLCAIWMYSGSFRSSGAGRTLQAAEHWMIDLCNTGKVVAMKVSRDSCSDSACGTIFWITNCHSRSMGSMILKHCLFVA